MPISWVSRYVKKRAVANKLFFLLYLFVVLRITNNRYRRTMKKMVCLLSVCLALVSCGMQGRSEKEIQTSDKAVVENSEITIIRKSKFPPNPERSVQFSGKRTKRSVQKKRLHTTLIKPEQKVNEDLCSGFIVS